MAHPFLFLSLLFASTVVVGEAVVFGEGVITEQNLSITNSDTPDDVDFDSSDIGSGYIQSFAQPSAEYFSFYFPETLKNTSLYSTFTIRAPPHIT